MIYKYYFDVPPIKPYVHWRKGNEITTLTMDSKLLRKLSRLLGTSHLIMCEALPIYQNTLKARVEMWTEAVELEDRAMADMCAFGQWPWSNTIEGLEEGKLWMEGWARKWKKIERVVVKRRSEYPSGG